MAEGYRKRSLSTTLYAALFVADFPVAALQQGKRRPAPTAVTCGEAPNQFIYAADAQARERGVREGMALSEARVRYGFSRVAEPLRVLAREQEAERRVQKQLLELALTVTPRFEDAAPGLVVLDFTGLRDPHSSATKLAWDAEKLGLDANIGVSQNRFVALCAARTQPGVTHVYPGQEAAFLQVQPLDVLPLEPKDLETLVRWGVHTVGELSRFSEDDLVERFGERGARMSRLARGEESSLLEAYQAPPRLEECQDLDWEIGRLEPLAFVMSGMLERLCFKLQGHNLAAASVSTRLKLAGGGSFERKIDLPYPLSDPRTLLSLVRIDLAAHPPGDAIAGVRLWAKPTERRRVQFSLFAPDLPSPEKLAVTLARLTGLVGRKRVGAPALPDTHRPGAAAVAAFAIRDKVEVVAVRTAVAKRPAVREPLRRLKPGGANLVPCPSRSSLVFRCFRPPWSAKVILRGRLLLYLDTAEVSGPVTARAGPWRVCGEWWTPEGWQYEEWDVEVEGRLYRICCERTTNEWFVTGEYD